MLWLLLVAVLLLHLYDRGWQLTALCLISVVISLLMAFFSFATGGLILLLYDSDAVRAWTLPAFWFDALIGSGNMLQIISLSPLVFVADLVRCILHILFAHPHPILWAFMIIGGMPIFSLWRNAIIAIATRHRPSP